MSDIEETRRKARAALAVGGGPAHPVSVVLRSHENGVPSDMEIHVGMSARDMFLIAALPLAHADCKRLEPALNPAPDAVVTRAHRYVDAILKARGNT